MCARAPSSTLFPYTTLFRSAGNSEAVLRGLRPDAVGAAPTKDSDRVIETEMLRADALAWSGDFEGARRAASRDRKSTRLNSSHTVISYAVFCLKKKIQQDVTQQQKELIASLDPKKPQQ